MGLTVGCLVPDSAGSVPSLLPGGHEVSSPALLQLPCQEEDVVLSDLHGGRLTFSAQVSYPRPERGQRAEGHS